MGIVITVVIAVLVFSLCVMGHPTSVIARKTDQSDTAEVLAWIPGLQFIPMIWAAGGTVWQVVVLSAAVVLSAVLTGFASGALGEGPLATLIGAYSTWVVDLYFLGFSGWLGWRLADRRALPPVFGLLLALPLLNVIATWVLAFHDGWARPHRGGLVAAAVLSLALILPGVYLAHHVDEEAFEGMLAEWGEAAMAAQMAELEAMESDGAFDGAIEGPAPTALPSELAERPPQEALPRRQNDRTIHALFELKGRFEQLDALLAPAAMDDDRMDALALVRSLRADLEGLHADLDRQTYEELAHHLNRLEASLDSPDADGASRSGSLVLGSKRSARTSGGSDAPAAAAPLAEGAPLRPFAVQVADACPEGTELRTRAGETGEEEWCQQRAGNGGLRHGWYARYFANGKPEQVGEYHEGLRIGVWTRFHPSGAVRAQAEFDAGLQHGWLLTFSESGERKKAVRFVEGSPLR
ncbi:MAG: hypothetical protein NXI30_07005 [bacterium]|nr:hypothetical protein [bacterium]